MHIKISKSGNRYCVDPIDLPGSPPCGYGSTMDAALGDFLRNHQEKLGIKIIVDKTVQPTEQRRRVRELAKR